MLLNEFDQALDKLSEEVELYGDNIDENVGLEARLSINVGQYHDISDKEENGRSLNLDLHGDCEAIETPEPNVEDVPAHHDYNDEENDEINQPVNELTDESKHHSICMNNEVINH